MDRVALIGESDQGQDREGAMIVSVNKAVECASYSQFDLLIDTKGGATVDNAYIFQ